MIEHRLRWIGALLPLCVLLLAGCSKDRSGQVLDEASQAGRTVATFPAADEDYLHDMDGGLALTREEIQGRNTWIVWTGGNDRFWDQISINSFGNFDLLKIVSSHASLKFNRDNRWNYLGLVNEPCFEKPTGPDPQRYGLWLDKRTAGCPADPCEKRCCDWNETAWWSPHRGAAHLSATFQLVKLARFSACAPNLRVCACAPCGRILRRKLTNSCSSASRK